MAGGASPNPFTSDNTSSGQYGNAVEYGTPNNAYAVPGPGSDAPYNDEFGWGPSPRISVSSTPDAMRVQSFPVRTVRPEDSDAPQVFYDPLDADDKRRHSVEEIDADGIEIVKDQLRRAADPRWNPPAETRITEKLSPHRYSFVRPWNQQQKGAGARTLNGTHFSMADHRRDYEILGMRPHNARRNTFRVDPTPWDSDMYDVPDPSTVGTAYQGRFQAAEIPLSGNGRSFRL